jgi:hypothetical protein
MTTQTSEEKAAKLLRSKGWSVTPPQEVQYGCFCDLFACDPGTKPDSCVIETSIRTDCTYANQKHDNGHYKIKTKEKC